MIVKSKTFHKITFTVQAFWEKEGGMGCDSFGEEVETLSEAIQLLELAIVKTETIDWMIIGHVSKENCKK